MTAVGAFVPDVTDRWEGRALSHPAVRNNMATGQSWPFADIGALQHLAVHSFLRIDGVVLMGLNVCRGSQKATAVSSL